MANPILVTGAAGRVGDRVNPGSLWGTAKAVKPS